MVGKAPVIGALVRKTNFTIAKLIEKVDRKTAHAFVEATSKPGATICTDESRVYRNIPNRKHGIVNHSNGEYVKGDAYTNGIESFWSILKRAIMGVHHHMSENHLNRYVIHLTGLWNLRGLDILDKLRLLLQGMARKTA